MMLETQWNEPAFRVFVELNVEVFSTHSSALQIDIYNKCMWLFSSQIVVIHSAFYLRRGILSRSKELFWCLENNVWDQMNEPASLDLVKLHCRSFCRTLFCSSDGYSQKMHVAVFLRNSCAPFCILSSSRDLDPWLGIIGELFWGLDQNHTDRSPHATDRPGIISRAQK